MPLFSRRRADRLTMAPRIERSCWSSSGLGLMMEAMRNEEFKKGVRAFADARSILYLGLLSPI